MINSIKNVISNFNYFFFFFVIIISSNFKYIDSVIYLPFKTKTKYFSSDEFFSEYLSTNFEIGIPPQNIEAEIDFQEIDFHLSYTRKYIYLSYNKSLSKTYINTTNYRISTNNFLSGCRANETFHFFDTNDLKRKKEYKNIPFFMSTSGNYKFGAVLGLAISWKGFRSFIYSLKYGGVIDSYTWTLQFNSLNDGFLIIGNEPHIYNNSFYDENKLKYTKIYKESNLFSWCFEINKIFSGNDLINLNINDKNIQLGIIRPEIGGIIAPWEYYENIKINYFGKYINNNICKEKGIFEKNISNNDYYNEEKIEYYKIECLKEKFNDLDMNNLPVLKIMNIPLNYSFCFSGNDLFLKENDEYIFQVYISNISYWYLGRLFLYKYQLIFNEDNKLIGFYTGKKEIDETNKNNNFFKVSLIVIISLFGIFLFFVFYKKIKIIILKNSKKNAKELEEDFSYKTKDLYDYNNNSNNNENELFNKND